MEKVMATGNTVTIEECKNKGSASGFDTTLDQECENLICTHLGENATCTQEGAVSAAVQQGNQTTPVNKMTCEQCFTSLLTVGQINTVLSDFRENSIPNLCSFLQQPNTIVVEDEFRAILNDAGVTDIATQNELIACLKNVGIVFPIDIG